MFEEGSQVRRAIKSVKSNIVEGYGRRRYKQEFVRCLDEVIKRYSHDRAARTKAR